MEERSFSLNDVVGIFRRRARLFVAVAGTIFLLSVMVAALLHDDFSVYTTILVEPQSISKKLVETGKEDADVMNRLHLMTMQILSRSRLSKVIDEFKLYPKESEKKTREQVIDMMRDRIHVEPLLPDLSAELKKSMVLQVNTFRLYFRHDDPVVAAAVANRLSNDFIDEHIKERVQSSGDTAEFVDSELARLTARMRELEASIAKVKSQNAGSLPDDMFANQRQIEGSFIAFTAAQDRLAEAESDQAFYSQQATVARESGLGGGGAQVYNQLVLSPNQRLQQLENQLGELRSRGFTDKHPDIVSTTAEMEQLRERIAKGGDEDPAGRAPTSVAELQARNESQRAALRVEGAKREADRLQKEVEEAQARLAATPRVAEQLDALESEYKNLTVSATDFSNKRLEAGVAANMERRQKGEQFRVLEPAYAPPEPTSPNRPLIIMLGLVLGVGTGVGVALLFDMADSSYHDPRALQVALRLPVLAAIPAILLDPDRMRMRRRNMREAFAALVITGFVLTSALVGYVVVNKPHLFGAKAEQIAPAPATAPATAPAAKPAATPAVTPGVTSPDLDRPTTPSAGGAG
jgi:polysaccharide chain length determinant protein (PEP-CTERM system associated)